MKRYRWRDGKEIFDTLVAHLRNIQNKCGQDQHTSIQKWYRYYTWTPNHKTIWKEIWVGYLPKKSWDLHGRYCVVLLLRMSGVFQLYHLQTSDFTALDVKVT